MRLIYANINRFMFSDQEVDIMDIPVSGGNIIESIMQIINLIIMLIILGISIYLIYLAIKALKIYIEKNS